MTRTRIITENDVVNNLTSNLTDRPLSASQGKTLNTSLTSHVNDITNPHNVTAAQAGAVAIAQGTENSNKYLETDASGNVTTGHKLGVIVKTYDELDQALNTPQTMHIILGADLVATRDLRMRLDNVINLNNHNITSDGNYHRFLDVNANLTIVGKGFISGFKTDSDNGACISINDGKTLTMRGGTIKNCQTNNSGGAVYNYGTFTLAGGTIEACSASMGGCIYNDRGTITITDGMISKCTAKYSSSGYSGFGGGIYSSDGSMTMSGGIIKECSAYSGGGISIDDVDMNKTFTMSGGTIRNCVATGTGGGIYNSGIISLSGGTITWNNARAEGGMYNSGGAIYTYNGSVTISNNPVVINNYTNETINNIEMLYGTTFKLDGTLLGFIGITTDKAVGEVFGTCTSGSANAGLINADNINARGKVEGTDLKWISA